MYENLHDKSMKKYTQFTATVVKLPSVILLYLEVILK